MRADRLEPKGYAVETGCLTSFRRELTRLPVYRADLNPPVMDAEHGNAASLDHAGRGHPNREAGQQAQPWDGRRSQSRPVMGRICLRRSGLERQERVVEPLQLGIAMDRRLPSPGAPKAAAHRSSSFDGRISGIAKLSGGITLRRVMQLLPIVSGLARKGWALDRFEPYEGKLSRTVLRGAWAG
jgi:hypothetical protein